jgi:hypothetical protein
MWATITVRTSRSSKLYDGARDQVTLFYSLDNKCRTPSHDVAVKARHSSVAGEKVRFYVKTALFVKDILSVLWPEYRPSTEWLQRRHFLLTRL